MSALKVHLISTTTGSKLWGGNIIGNMTMQFAHSTWYKLKNNVSDGVPFMWNG